MNSLLFMECGKTARSVTYWLYVIVLLATVILNYDTAVESELSRTDDPASVFYIAENGVYAETADERNEDMQRTMMIGATGRLLDNYLNNRYEYYPFGYVKEKNLPEEEQAEILSYLQELTGLSEQSLRGREQNGGLEDLQISGGAFVLDPGQGSTNESGQFVIAPGDWRYVGNESAQDSYENPENELKVQVSFERFKEIMSRVNALIGRNSYFSWTMLTMYYCENDMQDTPVTELQHREFYEKDHVTGAFARYFCDSISLVVLCLPAFVIIDLLLRDKRHKMRALIYCRTESSAKIICARFGATVGMTMFPILILPLRSLATLADYCGSMGIRADLFAFAAYTFAWIFPTILLTVAIGLFAAVLTENYFSVLFSGLIWLLGRPSVDKIAGGNYGLFDLIIRHNTLKGYGRMLENIRMLIWNRVLLCAVALALVAFTIMIYDMKRKQRVPGRLTDPCRDAAKPSDMDRAPGKVRKIGKAWETWKAWGNLRTVIAANIRMNYRYTVLPAVFLLLLIPFIYGTENLDCQKSADCLERMVAMIGIPMFTALVWQEHTRSLYETIAWRPLPFRLIVILRMGLSALCALLLIFAFEIYMCIGGCSFPVGVYAFRTLAASMTLGLTGLFLSSVTRNTVSGYLGAFCLSFVAQTEDLAGWLRPVTNGLSPALVLLLIGISMAILYWANLDTDKFWGFAH